MADLFFPQSVLDDWIEDGKIQLQDDELVLAGRTYKLEGAVHVLKCVSEDVDPHDLVHRVRKLAELVSQGADTLQKSLIFREQAYEVDPGFVGHVEESAVKPEAVAPAARARQVRHTMSIRIDSAVLAAARAAGIGDGGALGGGAGAAAAATATTQGTGPAEGRMRPVGKDAASQDAARIASEKLARDAAKAAAAKAGAPAPAAAAPPAAAPAAADPAMTDEELLTNFLLENL